jgi:hypothetical protein
LTEVWKDIPGYEGRYQVSDLGRVRSLDRCARGVSKKGREYQRCVRGVVLARGYSRGYPLVHLWPGGTIAVHLLVARTFLPGGRGDVNHMDGVKDNCALSNLEWGTKSYNQQHAVRAGLRRQALPVTDGQKTWPSQAQAAFELTGDRRKGASISRHLRGERPQALGRTWSFA